MQFGIALPKWIVDGKNSYIVLGAYVLVFMIIMPTLVVNIIIIKLIIYCDLLFKFKTLKGIWWYKSIKYTGDQILIRTSQMYYYLIMKNPQVILKRKIFVFLLISLNSQLKSII